MFLDNRVEINPKVILGKPMIRCTRINVELIVRRLSERVKEEDLRNAYSPPQCRWHTGCTCLQEQRTVKSE